MYLNGRFTFPADDDENHPQSNCKQIPQDISNIILDSFERTCIESSLLFVQFHDARFLPLHVLSRFIAHYFGSFHQTLPFIHLPSFDTSTSHWLVLLGALAFAAVGSHYYKNDIYAKPMHEFVRRAIRSMETKEDSSSTNVIMIHVKLLNCVGMMYGGWEDLSQAARSYHRDLMDFRCYEWKALNEKDRNHRIGMIQEESNISERINREWKEWCEAESIRGTGYCIWVCMFLVILDQILTTL